MPRSALHAHRSRRAFGARLLAAFLTLIACVAMLCACVAEKPARGASGTQTHGELFSQSFVAPIYDGELSIVVNDDMPDFSDMQGERSAFIKFSLLDSYGRCGAAAGIIGPETLPQGPRAEIQSVSPTGFHNAEYPWIERKWVYNRCHLIAFMLGGGDANEQNLITGTYSFNTKGMLPIEERIASYIERTGNHVRYRVSPFFEGHELVARGVLMEAQSLEDDGASLSLCRYCFNVELGVAIDYATGYTEPDGSISATTSVQADAPDEQVAYVLNTSSMRFHMPDCKSVSDMSERNRLYFTGSRDEAVALGYRPCGYCNP